MTITKSPSHILTAAFGIGCLFDVLFWGKLPGVSVLLFVLTLVAALVSLGRMADVPPVRRNLWIVVPLVFFAAMVAVRSNWFLLVLDVLVSIVLLALLAYFYAAGRIDKIGMAGYYISFMVAAANTLFRAAPLVPATVRASGVGGAGRQGALRMLPVLRGLVIALPVAIVFIVLLASADAVFAQYVAALFKLDFLPDVRALMWQVAVALQVAWIVAGGLVFALTRRDTDEEDPWETAMSSIPKVLHIGFVEGATVLVVVDLIFLFFGWIQLSYLFGGQSNITIEGYTFADYARRGFFELLAVSLLTMGLILGLHWLTWRETGRQSLVFRLLATLMAALTLVLIASAFYRMTLYEEAYGYTHLRLYVHLFEVWLALLFGWLLVTLWVKPRKFAIGCFVAAMGFLATLNIANLDGIIAEQNLAYFSATGKIDIYYLSTLSEDGIPTLLNGLDSLPADDQAWLLYNLNQRFQTMKNDANWRELPSLNLSRWQAYNTLEQNQARLAQARIPNYTPQPTSEVSGDSER